MNVTQNKNSIDLKLNNCSTHISKNNENLKENNQSKI